MHYYGDNQSNPMGPKPPAPEPGQAKENEPGRGDHVFGNIIKEVQNGLEAIIGGGDEWIEGNGQVGRFGRTVEVYNLIDDVRTYNPNDDTVHQIKTDLWRDAYVAWDALSQLDLGHSAGNEISTTRHERELDIHSAMSGGYAKIFIWNLCEIGHVANPDFAICFDSPNIGATWRNEVLLSYRETLNYIVDQTALERFIGIDGGDATHQAISLGDALDIIGNHGRGRDKATQDKIKHIKLVCSNFKGAAFCLQNVLEAMRNINIYWDTKYYRWRDMGF